MGGRSAPVEASRRVLDPLVAAITARLVLNLLVAAITTALISFIFSPMTEAQSVTEGHTFRIYQRDGITVAENRGGPKYQGELFRYEPVRILKEDESRPESLIGQPYGAFRMGEDGSVYLHDWIGHRILRFDPTGTYVNDIGRVGQGPGEYENPYLLPVRDETVMIFDPHFARTSLFRPDGSLIRTISAPFVRRRLSFQACFPLPDGGSLLIDQVSRRETVGYEEHSMVVTIFSSGGDTSASISTEMVTGSYLIRADIAWRIFPGWADAAYHPERGIYLTTGLEPVINIYDLAGHLMMVMDVGLPPEPVTRAERRAVEAGLRRQLDNIIRNYPEDRTAFEERIKHVELNDPKAFWGGMLLDENGWLWLERPDRMFWFLTGDLSAGFRHTYKVLSPDGEYLGETQPPCRQGNYSRGHFIASQENEETGGFDIVVFRIVPAVEGLIFPDIPTLGSGAI
jgi:hypothetical protein